MQHKLLSHKYYHLGSVCIVQLEFYLSIVILSNLVNEWTVNGNRNK